MGETTSRTASARLRRIFTLDLPRPPCMPATGTRVHRLSFGLLLLLTLGVLFGVGQEHYWALVSKGVPFVHITAWDEDGVPLFATDEAEARRIQRETGATLWGAGHPALGAVPLEVGQTPGRPGDLRAPLMLFADQLQLVGDRVTTGLLPNPYGIWNEMIELPRVRGPFPLQYTVPRADFERLYGVAEANRTFELTVLSRVPARIVSVENQSVTYESALSDGQDLVLDRLDLPMRVSLDPTGPRFLLTLQATVGHTFGLTASCENPIYNLRAGSYRVDAVTTDTLELRWADVPYATLVARDIRFVAEVVDVRPLPSALHANPPEPDLQSLEQSRPG